MQNMEWYQTLNKSLLTPPDWVFSVVWPILYIMIGLSLYVFIKASSRKKRFWPLFFFVLQLGLNLVWSPIFFGAMMITSAYIVILLMIVFTVLTIAFFRLYSKMSALLLVPYFLWLCFAAYLNYMIMVLN